MPRTLGVDVLRAAQQTAAGAGRLLVVAGDAGHGKTTLLWWLAGELRRSSDTVAWLIRAERLRDTKNQERRLALEDLLSARQTLPTNCRLVLLLDTIDLMLHNQADRDVLRLFLQGALDEECTVIAACRPNEFRQLNVKVQRKFDLESYDEQELPAAVELHLKTLYPSAQPSDLEAQLHAVLNASSQGRPLKAICRVPVTLRMLFVLYSPLEAIPDEINVNRLFREYWKRRVEADKRSAYDEPHRTDDLSATARACALVLLADGKTDLSGDHMRERIKAFAGVTEHIERLLQRGLLVEHRDGSMGFFHQTFFEHAAARAVLHRFGVGGIERVRQRVDERRIDLFVLPILEQCLLTSELVLPHAAARVDAITVELLCSHEFSQCEAGIAVAMLLENPREVVRAAVRRQIPAYNEEAMASCLRQIPNGPVSRAAEFFTYFAELWSHGTARVRQQVLEVMTYLAGLEPREVLRFLATQDVVSFTVAQGLESQALRRFVRILASLFPTYAKAAWKYFDSLIAGDRRIAERLYVQVVMAEAIAKCGTAETNSHLVHFARLVESRNARLFDEALAVLGPTQARVYTASSISAAALFEQVLSLGASARNPPPSTLLLLLGFSEWAKLQDRATAEQLISLLRQAPLLWQAFWCRHALARALSQVDRVEQEQGAFRRELLQWIGSCFDDALTFSRVASLSALQRALVSAQATALVTADVPWSALEPVIHIGTDESIAAFLDETLLGPALAHYCLHGIGVAVHAFRVMVENPAKNPRGLLARTANYLIDLEELPDWLVPELGNLLIASGDAVKLRRVLERHPHVITASPSVTSWLQNWIEQGTTSRSGKERRGAVALWTECVRKLDMEAPRVEHLLELYQRESDVLARSALSTLIGVAGEVQPSQRAQAADFLLRLASSNVPTVKDRAYPALIRCIGTDVPLTAKLADDVISVALREPTDEGKAGLLNNVIANVAQIDAVGAWRLLKALLEHEKIVNASEQGKRDLAHHLAGASRAILLALPLARVHEMINVALAMDRHRARLLLSAVCHRRYEDVQERIAHIMSAPSTTEGVKAILHRYFYFNTRPAGSETWPELFTMPIAVASSPTA